MPQGKLLELKIEITRNCPLECLHCSSEAYPSCPEHLPTERVLSLLREFARMGGQRVCFSGGEPLLHEGLNTILLATAEVGLDASLYTCGISYRNGGLKPIPDDVVETLVRTRTHAIVSLHGAGPGTHEAVTGVEGSFGATLETLRILVSTGVSTQAHVVPMLPNYAQLDHMTALLVEAGTDRLSWLRFVPQGRGFKNRQRLQLTPLLLHQLPQLRGKIAARYPEFGVRMGAPFNVLGCDNPVACGAAVDVVTVRPDGTVAPCDGFKQIRIPDPYGNVLEHSLETVYRRSSLLSQVRAYVQRQNLEACTRCPLRERCGSGCLAQKVATAGWEGDERDPACPLLSGIGVHDFQTAAIR